MLGSPRPETPPPRSVLWRVIFWPFTTAASILLYIAALLRLTNSGGRTSITQGRRRRRRRDPRLCAEEFIRAFEACYGSQHPNFLESSYTQALDNGKSNLKFLLIYLHSEEHDETDAFCRNVLASTQLCDLLTRHQFLCWAGDIEDQEAFQVSTTLEATGYPFLAVIALHMPGAMSAASVLSSSAKMTVIDRLDGITNVDTIITRLQRTVDRYEGQLEIARAERRQREMNRMLREEQDAAYQASLRADQEKERRAREARELEERKRQETERKQREQEQLTRKRIAYLHYLRANLPDEPSINEENTARLGVRLPDGRRITRRFRGQDLVQDVFAFIDTIDLEGSELNESSSSPPADYTHTYPFILVSPFPRTEYTAEQADTAIATLKDWWPSANLVVEPLEGDEGDDD